MINTQGSKLSYYLSDFGESEVFGSMTMSYIDLCKI